MIKITKDYFCQLSDNSRMKYWGETNKTKQTNKKNNNTAFGVTETLMVFCRSSFPQLEQNFFIIFRMHFQCFVQYLKLWGFPLLHLFRFWRDFFDAPIWQPCGMSRNNVTAICMIGEKKSKKKKHTSSHIVKQRINHKNSGWRSMVVLLIKWF